MDPFHDEFKYLLKKRHDLIGSKEDKLVETKNFKQSIAGPKINKYEERSKEQFELHKNFSHAGKYQKKQFHLQIKKRNTDQGNLEILNKLSKHQFSDFKLLKKRKLQNIMI